MIEYKFLSTDEMCYNHDVNTFGGGGFVSNR